MLLATPVACLVFSLVELWERHPAYHFFPLPLVALVWFMVRCDGVTMLRHEQPALVRGLFGLHLALALTAFLLVSPFLAGLAFCVAMTAYAVVVREPTEDAPPRWLFPALALFFIPPPLELDMNLHQLLASAATRLSQGWLDAMQVLHVVEGLTVVTPQKRFFVDDACSGTHSMLAAVCAALILCGMKKRSLMHAVFMLLTASMISVVTNVLRICVVIASQQFWSLELDAGIAHDALGVVVFGLDLLLVWCADNGWHFILNHSATRHKQPDAWDQARSAARGRGLPAGLSLMVAIVGGVMFTGPLLLGRAAALQAEQETSAVIDEITMPARLSGWEREGTKPLEDSVIGKVSVRNQVWLYRKDELEAYVAVNYPFPGFHDTRVCYKGQGWEFEKQVDTALPGDAGNTVRFLEMKNPAEFSEARLWLCVLNAFGNCQSFASEDRVGRLADRLFSRWTAPAPVTTTYVLQIMNLNPGKDEQTQHACTELLAGARAHLSGVISGRNEPHGKESE